LTIPAIIDEDTFQATQEQLQRNRALARRNRKYDYLFGGGRFRCGRCGRGMTGFPLWGVRYYRCNGRNQIMDRERRCRGSLQADLLVQGWLVLVNRWSIPLSRQTRSKRWSKASISRFRLVNWMPLSVSAVWILSGIAAIKFRRN
jgi:hypothetical protein